MGPGAFWSVSILCVSYSVAPALLGPSVGGSRVQERQEGRGEVGGVGAPIPEGRAEGGVLGEQALLPLLTATRPLTRPLAA